MRSHGISLPPAVVQFTLLVYVTKLTSEVLLPFLFLLLSLLNRLLKIKKQLQLYFCYCAADGDQSEIMLVMV